MAHRRALGSTAVPPIASRISDVIHPDPAMADALDAAEHGCHAIQPPHLESARVGPGCVPAPESNGFPPDVHPAKSTSFPPDHSNISKAKPSLRGSTAAGRVND